MLQLVHGLRARGWRPEVAGPPGGDLDHACRHAAIDHIGVDWRPAGLARPLGILHNTRHLRAVIRARRPAIVHANSFLSIKIAAPARMLGGPPLVGSIRDIVPFTRPTLLAFGRCDAVVCVSKATAEHLLRLASPRLARRVQVIYNGVDTAATATAQPDPEILAWAREAGLETLIACISPLVRWKGQHVLLRALARVASENRKVGLVLAGHDRFADPGFLEEVRALASAPAVADRVRFLGFRRDIPAILAASDVVVVPSIKPDPLPRAVLEGMASGAAVVATATGGIPEAVDDRKNGLLVPPSDPEALAAALLEVSASPTLSQELAGHARETIRDRFSLERHTERMLELYTSLVTGGRPRGEERR